MTLREMFPEWWCKVTFSVPENCSEDYNLLDFSIYEFIFTVVIVLVIKWIIYCFLFIIGLIIPDKTVDATIISPSLLEKEIDIPNNEIKDIKGGDLEFDEDVFSLEEELKKMPKRESKLDRVWVEWNNLTNDREKRQYCNELEEVIKSLEGELNWKNKDIDKLNKTRKQLGGYLVVSIIFLLVGWWLFFITKYSFLNNSFNLAM